MTAALPTEVELRGRYVLLDDLLDKEQTAALDAVAWPDVDQLAGAA